jgi:hypothetical protein
MVIQSPNYLPWISGVNFLVGAVLGGKSLVNKGKQVDL